MAKKKSWFSLLKGLFVSEARPEKRKRKWAFWRLKIKARLPSITAPSPPSENQMGFQGEGEHEKPQAPVEVIPIPDTLRSEGHEGKDPTAKAEPPFDSQFEDRNCGREQIEELASIRIQTAFRGLLARKALCALKGIVKLQAYIRGRAVRRQTVTTLKYLQSVVSIQSQVCARRIQITEDKELQTFKDKIIRVDTNSQRRWDDSLLTKEEVEAMVLNKQEAAIKRERIRKYAVTHRKSAESYQRRPNSRWKYWLDQWVDTQLSKSRELEDLDFNCNQKQREEIFKERQIKPRSNSPRKILHHRKLSSGGEDEHNPFLTSRSPTVALPTYMAATESAKAKARSLSSPRMRPLGNTDFQSESNSPYKNKLCLTTSVMSEARSSLRSSAYQERSPSLRGFTNTGPVKSSHNMLKDLSINSECALPSWNRQSTFR